MDENIQAALPHVGIGVAAGIVVMIGVSFVRRILAENPETLPIEHRAEKPERAAKSALRTLQRYVVDNVGPTGKTMSLDEIADRIKERELQWPEPRQPKISKRRDKP